VPAAVRAAPTHATASRLDADANDDRKPAPTLAIVTIRMGGSADVPDMTPEEHQRRGDAAEALFREMKRRIAAKVRQGRGYALSLTVVPYTANWRRSFRELPAASSSLALRRTFPGEFVSTQANGICVTAGTRIVVIQWEKCPRLIGHWTARGRVAGKASCRYL
jgi:hypothetical protein